MITQMPRTAPTRERRTRNAARTREAILDRAVDLASTQGLEGLTIGRLATDLEMSKSGLFGHFGSKEELQLATIEAASGRFVTEVIQPTLAEPEGAPRLRALARSYLDYLERGVFAGGCFFAAASIEFDDRPGPVGDRIRRARPVPPVPTIRSCWPLSSTPWRRGRTRRSGCSATGARSRGPGRRSSP
jgi:AcrR family transcriptional regulator